MGEQVEGKKGKSLSSLPLDSTLLYLPVSWILSDCLARRESHSTELEVRVGMIAQRIAYYRDLVDSYAKEHWIFVCIQLAVSHLPLCTAQVKETG